MSDQSKEEESPLFKLDDKELIRFAHRTRNLNIGDTVNSEMMRRMKISIEKFNNQSSKQTNKMIKLTYWIIGLTVTLGVLAIVQIALFVG